jgi:hypothetical protein
VEDFITSFDHLDFRTKGMADAFFMECFINGIKDEICAHVLMECPHTCLEATQQSKEEQQIISSQIQKPPFLPCHKPTNPTPPATPLKIHKLTRDEMVDHQLKGLCYNCDEKYFLGHKCKEHKIFMAINEDASKYEAIVSPMHEVSLPCDLTPPSNPREFELVISLNSLTRFSSP